MIARCLAYAVASLPLVGVGAFYLFAAAAALDLGHWPRYGDTASFENTLGLPVFVALGAALVSPVVLIWPAFVSLHPRYRWLRRPAALYIGGWLVACSLVSIDPGRTVEWFLD